MTPFTALHVCMGNICRSPMAERLLARAAAEIAAERAERLVLSHSAGTGGWHVGEPMNPPAARQLRARGAADAGFAARKLRAEHLDSADLVLTATAEQQEYVLNLRPDAESRTFVLGEFGRLLAAVDAGALPPAGDAEATYARGVALVGAVDKARDGAEPRPEDDLDDPWGRGDAYFSRVADEIEQTVRPLATLLLGDSRWTARARRRPLDGAR